MCPILFRYFIEALEDNVWFMCPTTYSSMPFAKLVFRRLKVPCLEAGPLAPTFSKLAIVKQNRFAFQTYQGRYLLHHAGRGVFQNGRDPAVITGVDNFKREMQSVVTNCNPLAISRTQIRLPKNVIFAAGAPTI